MASEPTPAATHLGDPRDEGENALALAVQGVLCQDHWPLADIDIVISVVLSLRRARRGGPAV